MNNDSEDIHTYISPYFIRVIKNYLQDRHLQVSESKMMDIKCGVLQSSVLGPTLWNICYDSVLKMKTPRQVNLTS